eukprot:CAMPEP_0180030036 /NCGR_PEP_ID=MMETSP0984-20121128/27147_1 /TAXON_ID=483367 /ORGANISM="non described non described, Strain CCMP 2436" /LENGTH=225 /DNA_ID=CAMNT_0021955053 /DNA_START=185 /DNA_END=861 /DNA_ORIENTATION=-
MIGVDRQLAIRRAPRRLGGHQLVVHLLRSPAGARTPARPEATTTTLRTARRGTCMTRANPIHSLRHEPAREPKTRGPKSDGGLPGARYARSCRSSSVHAREARRQESQLVVQRALFGSVVRPVDALARAQAHDRLTLAEGLLREVHVRVDVVDLGLGLRPHEDVRAHAVGVSQRAPDHHRGPVRVVRGLFAAHIVAIAFGMLFGGREGLRPAAAKVAPAVGRSAR